MKIILYSLAILLAIYTEPASSAMKERCQNIDIVLVIDASASIGDANFELAKKAMISLVDQLDIGKDRVRLGFFSFSNYIEPGATLEDKYQDKMSLINQIRSMKYIAGSTGTGPAIGYARQIFQASPRKKIPRIAVIFTDGASDSYAQVLLETDSIKAERIDLFSVGIGNYLNHNELNYIASEPIQKYKKLIKDYVSLVTEIDSIAETACSSSTFVDINKPVVVDNSTETGEGNFQIDVGNVTSCIGASKRFFRIDFDVLQGQADLVASYDYIITDKPRTEAVMRMMNLHRDQRNLNTFGLREYFVPYRTDRKRLYIAARAYGEAGSSYTFKVTPI